MLKSNGCIGIQYHVAIALARHLHVFVSYYYLCGTRSTAPLLLLPSVQPASAPATPEGPTDAQVVQLRRFHLHHVRMPIYRSAIYLLRAWAAHQYQLHVAVQARAADWIFNISISPSYILDCAGGKVTSELTTSEAREGWPFPPEPRKLSRYSLESDLLCRQLIIGG